MQILFGICIGALLLFLMSPIPPERSLVDCGVRKVRNEVQVAYVLKGPDPQTCVPPVAETRVVEHEPEKEPPVLLKSRRHVKHRRHRRYW